MRRVALTTLASVSLLLPRLYAPPPLITGDVPTAERGDFELYSGFRYQDTGQIQRQLPHVELVYGLAGNWEASVELNYLSRAGQHGPDDVTLATKMVLVPESASHPAIGASYEFKAANGNAERGLGTGGEEHDFRLRAQKSFDSLTSIFNVGHVFVPDATVEGQRSARQDVWRASFAQEWAVTAKTKLLGEIYWRTTDTPGEAPRLGWNVGFKQKMTDALTFHGAIGESLRASNRGGPDLRVYIGVKYEFAAPWQSSQSQ